MNRSIALIAVCAFAQSAAAQNGSDIGRPHFQQQMAQGGFGFAPPPRPCTDDVIEAPPPVPPGTPERPYIFIPLSMNDLQRVSPGGSRVCEYTYSDVTSEVVLAANLVKIGHPDLADEVFFFIKNNPGGCVITMPIVGVLVNQEEYDRIRKHAVIIHCLLRLHHGLNGRGMFNADGTEYKPGSVSAH